MKKVRKAVIPIAGLGTRFLPATKSYPKEMFPIVDIPVLMLILKECLDSGITDVFIIISKEKECVKDFLKHNSELEENLKLKNKLDLLDDLNRIIDNMSFTFGYQREDFIGSGGACYVAKDWVNNEPFAVLFGDDLNFTEKNTRPAIGQLIDAYEQTGKMIIGCKYVEEEEVTKYGACKIVKKVNDNLYEISGIIEKPKYGEEPSHICGLARYVMPENTFEYIEKLGMITSKNKEVGLTETMDLIMKDTNAYACIMNSIRYDTGDKLGFLKATVEYALRDEKLGEQFRGYLKSLKL